MSQPTEPMIILRVLIEFDSSYNVFVARCLETGSVATADDPEMAEDMMKELLVDELTYALKNDNLGNLFSSPAAWDVWRRFQEVGNRPLLKPMQKAIRARDNEEVPTEIKIARAH